MALIRTGSQKRVLCTGLGQRVAAHAKDLKPDYNLDAAAASFDALLTSPQPAIDAAKIKKATAKATLSALNTFLKDDLRAGMELLKDTQPNAYRALREVSQV